MLPSTTLKWISTVVLLALWLGTWWIHRTAPDLVTSVASATMPVVVVRLLLPRDYRGRFGLVIDLMAVVLQLGVNSALHLLSQNTQPRGVLPPDRLTVAYALSFMVFLVLRAATSRPSVE